MKTLLATLGLWSSLFGPDFQTYEPLRKPTNESIVADLSAHLPRPGEYLSGGPVDTAHEMTHGVNGLLRDRVNGLTPEGTRQTFNCFYLLENRYVVLREPKFTLADVAKRIPVTERDSFFKLYFAGSIAKAWNDHPLYLCDEMVAYTHAALVHDLDPAGFAGDVANAKRMSRYAHLYLLAAIDELDPTYPDRTKLEEFLDWNADRIPTLKGNE